MIIRLSVNDNDFQEVLEEYLSNFIRNVENTEKLTEHNAVHQYEIQKKLIGLLNPNMLDFKSSVEGKNNLSESDKEFLIEQIKKSFSYWCQYYYPDDECKLSEWLDIQLLDCMTDKWENGEACYWFQHSGVVLTQ